MSCPFYGKAGIASMKTLVGTGGNQCALITDAIAPCRLEVWEERTPDLQTCEMNGTARAVDFAQFHVIEFHDRENRG